MNYFLGGQREADNQLRPEPGPVSEEEVQGQLLCVGRGLDLLAGGRLCSGG